MHRLFHLGVAGLILLAIADSSFLVLPFGNDVLLVILVARDHGRVWEYVLGTAGGSVLGVLLLDWVCRKRGETGIESIVGAKRFKRLKDKIQRHAPLAIGVACLAPPPFPFTPVIAAASAFQYPRAKLLAAVFGARMLRYSLVAYAAIYFGTHILRIARSREFVWAMIAFSVGCGVASTISVMRWMRHPSR